MNAAQSPETSTEAKSTRITITSAPSAEPTVINITINCANHLQISDQESETEAKDQPKVKAEPEAEPNVPKDYHAMTRLELHNELNTLTLAIERARGEFSKRSNEMTLLLRHLDARAGILDMGTRNGQDWRQLWNGQILTSPAIGSPIATSSPEHPSPVTGSPEPVNHAASPVMPTPGSTLTNSITGQWGHGLAHPHSTYGHPYTHSTAVRSPAAYSARTTSLAAGNWRTEDQMSGAQSENTAQGSSEWENSYYGQGNVGDAW
ncbi:hypothetical protein BDV25DRAFT_135919 [Aspergillus avenaceus]|uniref:Uncharacterized protein n=1 Tax=Aspergillus avenaceus TaxID=36643 RepID=A0A5N6U761_ASPAV|nr:hypothetical protein BDV25DRAFT_135919 [Aspergillus avenaceus]